ncbi:MAG: putative baseplate assembly protein [Rhizomicrobium sp.]
MKEDCGCCDGIEIITPVTECNPPGLSAIAYRAGTFATFYETMLARLSNLYLDVPALDSDQINRIYPLQALTARDTSDPSIALLDAWAVVGDVLTFYQERIANEGYLPTALERRSILELARLVGYRMRPGVAASVYLAFTAALGFVGTIPAGTRAQSIPGTGETPQFFETSDPLDARDVWNAIKPRLARPQFITPHDDSGDNALAVTDVAFIDTLYLDGITTNIKTGDAMLFLFGNSEQSLRLVESIEAQPDDKRTEIAFVPGTLIDSQDSLDLIVNKAIYLFPGNTLAQSVATIVSNLKNNLVAKLDDDTGGSTYFARLGFIETALAQLREQQAIAEGRKFSRVSAWIYHIVETLRHYAGALADQSSKDGATVVAMPSALEASPLRNLYGVIDKLGQSRSVQPANQLRLGRSITQSFAPDSDIAPRLLAALKPAVADTLYPAWRAIPKPTDGVEVYAMRAKASLFASRYTGPANIPAATQVVTYTTQPKIGTDWPQAVNTTNSLPAFLPLDATFDQIKPGTWIAVDRPHSKIQGQRVLTYHFVTEVRPMNMDTGKGYSASVTALTIAPKWLQELTQTGGTEQLSDAVGSTDVLRGTIVYAQAERMTMVDEPIDTDVSRDTVSLDGVYDGLEPGRWVIVSGNRTDIPNVSGVKTSELAMLAGVSQGTEPPMCAVFPAGLIPFDEIKYTTPANAQGDRLVVGVPSAALLEILAGTAAIDPPKVRNQEYCQQAELAPGFYANAYVPTLQELSGYFTDFAGLLTNPDSSVPYTGGYILDAATQGHIKGQDSGPPAYFAWRISQGKLHTTLTLAAPLSYTYDTASVSVYGNVVKATHGQTIGEVLGDGSAAKAYQTFALRQSPLTYVSAPTAEGTASTLKITVNEIEWHEGDNLLLERPGDRTFITRAGDDSKTFVAFGDGRHGARVPTGTANVKATYRYGIGAAGNVRAEQISQLATQPLGAQGVINPLAASGGADRDGAEDGRRNAPMAVMALDRLVSVKDYADFSRTYAGIGKATAARLSDGHKQVVHVTVAGAGDIPIDPTSDLYNNLFQSLVLFGDPSCPVVLAIRKVRLLVMSMNVALLPDYQWEAVEPVIRAAMLDQFGFEARALGQSAYLSEAVRLIQEIDGVSHVEPRIFDSVSEDITASALANLARTLGRCDAVAAALARPNPVPGDPTGRILAAELVFLSPDIADTLILTNIGA